MLCTQKKQHDKTDRNYKGLYLQKNFIELVENVIRLSAPQSQSAYQLSRLQLMYLLRYLANAFFFFFRMGDSDKKKIYRSSFYYFLFYYFS